GVVAAEQHGAVGGVAFDHVAQLARRRGDERRERRHGGMPLRPWPSLGRGGGGGERGGEQRTEAENERAAHGGLSLVAVRVQGVPDAGRMRREGAEGKVSGGRGGAWRSRRPPRIGVTRSALEAHTEARSLFSHGAAESAEEVAGPGCVRPGPERSSPGSMFVMIVVSS